LTLIKSILQQPRKNI